MFAQREDVGSQSEREHACTGAKVGGVRNQTFAHTHRLLDDSGAIEQISPRFGLVFQVHSSYRSKL